MKNTKFTMHQPFWFQVYRLNIPETVNRKYDIDNEQQYNATDDCGYCCFDDNLSVWRQTDDWYCSIRSNEKCNSTTINDYLQDVYRTLSIQSDTHYSECQIRPSLLFSNLEIV